jgi:hypothetical protein
MTLIDAPSIVKLTPEQESNLREYLRDWRSISDKQPVDRRAVNAALETIYRGLNRETTPIVFCQSPWQLVVVRAMLKLFSTSQAKTLPKALQESLKNPLWMKASERIEEHWATLDTLFSRRRSEGPGTSNFLSDEFFNDFQSSLQLVLQETLSKADKTLDPQMGISAKLQLRNLAHDQRRNGQSMLVQDLFGGRFGGRSSLPPRLEQFMTAGLSQEMLGQCSGDLQKQIGDAAEEFTKDMDVRTQRRNGDSELMNPRITMLFNVSLEYMGLLGDLRDLPIYGFIVEHLAAKMDTSNEQQIRAWLALKRNLFHICCYDKLSLACEYPEVVKTNNQGNLHCDTGPALVFRDGYKVYAINGVSVNADIIENRSGITVERIDAETNVEFRRIMVNLYGLQKYLEDSHAIPIDKNESGVLYRKDVRDDEPFVVVKVKNSTPDPDGTFNEYFLRVPPYIKTVGAAIAWTFGMEDGEYRPSAQS